MAKYPNCPEVYEVFQEFMKQCLENDKSLIWPDKEVWTLENLQKIKTNFIDNPLWGRDFWTKIFEQFSGLNEECWCILADAFFAYVLPSTYMKPEKKYEYINKICEEKQIDLPEFSEDRWNVFNQGFTRTGIQYHQKYKQLWLIFLFAIEIKKKNNRRSFLEDHRAVKNLLFKILDNDIEPQDRAYGMLNAILHMGYPEYYERMISQEDKKKAVKYYQDRIDENIKEEGDIDDKLLSIRKSFEEKEFESKDDNFDFYLSGIKEEWREDKSIPDNDSDTEDIVDEDPLLDELVKSLRRHKQIILYGPPGTGKTYYAKKLARTVIAQDNFEKDYDQLSKKEKQILQPGYVNEEEDRTVNKGNGKYLRFSTFHPAYGYEDFIEGYRPIVTEKGQPAFELKDGIFKKVCCDAKKNPEKSFVLIIDEINRGDIPKIFGELITLIEPDKRWNPKDDSPDTAVTLPTSSETFAVPENVIIIGTMNTADQSIALLDVALRRRFGFRELMPMPELLENQEIEGINLGDWLKELNHRVQEKVGRNLQVGHSYLMKNEKPINSKELLLASITDEILPLLQEYCYNDYSTLEEILGPKIVNGHKGGFNQQIFSANGQEIVIGSIKEMIDEVEEDE